MPYALACPDSIAPRPWVVPGALECLCRERGPDAVCVHVAGALDLATSPLLAQTLRSAELRARRVVLDLRELTFMDPSSVHVIVDASVRARRVKRQLILVRGPSQVDRVFTLTGAANVLEIGDLDPTEPPAPVPFRELQNDYAA